MKLKNRKAIVMLTWDTPRLEDGNWIKEIVNQTDSMGSDTSFANIYLLRQKYETEISHYKNFLIRRYNGTGSRKGYTFPLGNGDYNDALVMIEQDAKERGEKLQFCLLTEEQKDYIDQYFNGRFDFECNDGDSDYIYTRQDLANLSGKNYHKKKNHVSKFKRTYPDYQFKMIDKDNHADAIQVQNMWYYEHLQSESPSQLKEYEAIKEALDHFDSLNLMGGLIYINDTPVAMTIASKISENVCDIHFEKAIGECALYGGYSAINMFFAQELTGCEWINREEDIGIEGLRKAKKSYHPKMMLNKYSAIEK